MSAVLVALGVAGAIILVFGVRGSNQKIEAALPTPLQPIEAIPRPPRGAVPATVIAPSTRAAPPDLAQAQGTVVTDLEDTLRRQRLWGRVVITGARVDVRSGSCADPAMRPLIDGKRSLLTGAGLTKLRCVEQSGAVVFERDL
jgi:hypothetical protein